MRRNAPAVLISAVDTEREFCDSTAAWGEQALAGVFRSGTLVSDSRSETTAPRLTLWPPGGLSATVGSSRQNTLSGCRRYLGTETHWPSRTAATCAVTLTSASY